MQIFLTIVSGVVLFLFGQMSMVFVLEPIKNFNRQRGDIVYYLYRFRTIIESPDLKLNESDEEFVGDMGAAVAGAVSEISFYDSMSQIAFFRFPTKVEIFEAAKIYTSFAIKFKNKTLGSKDFDDISRVASLLKTNISP